MTAPRTFRQHIISALKWIGWVILVQIILINICAAFYAYKLSHFYEKVNETPFEERNIFSRSWRIFTGPKYGKQPVTEKPAFVTEEVDLTLENASHIQGWYGHASDSSPGTVIFFHGIGGNRNTLEDEAAAFVRKNYNVLLIDFRAHGNSPSSTCTIGYREGEEVKKCFDYIQGKGEKNIFLYGSSMGAVSVLRSLYMYNFQPKGVILDMPFLSLQDYLKAKARLIGFPNQPFAFLTTFWMGVERGFNGYKHNSSRYAGSVKCPVLMQWGNLDDFVLRKETDAIYESLGSKNKKLVVYTGAFHESFLRKDPLKWKLETDRFLLENNN